MSAVSYFQKGLISEKKEAALRGAASVPVIFGSRRSGAIKGGVRGRGSMMLLHTAQRVLASAGGGGGRGPIRAVQ